MPTTTKRIVKKLPVKTLHGDSPMRPDLIDLDVPVLRKVPTEKNYTPLLIVLGIAALLLVSYLENYELAMVYIK